jgi:hypothetical protein
VYFLFAASSEAETMADEKPPSEFMSAPHGGSGRALMATGAV